MPGSASITASGATDFAFSIALIHMLKPMNVGLHGIVGHGLVVLLEGLPGLDEGLVGRVLDRLEVVPGREVAEQRTGVDAGQLLLADREGDDRNVGRLDAWLPSSL